MATRKLCRQCDAAVSKNDIGLNKKLIHPEVKEFFCLLCLAEFLDIAVDELKEKIEEFKAEGCPLF
jgi:hypothetical protein